MIINDSNHNNSYYRVVNKLRNNINNNNTGNQYDNCNRIQNKKIKYSQL